MVRTTATKQPTKGFLARIFGGSNNEQVELGTETKYDARNISVEKAEFRLVEEELSEIEECRESVEAALEIAERGVSQHNPNLLVNELRTLKMQIVAASHHWAAVVRLENQVLRDVKGVSQLEAKEIRKLVRDRVQIYGRLMGAEGRERARLKSRLDKVNKNLSLHSGARRTLARERREERLNVGSIRRKIDMDFNLLLTKVRHGETLDEEDRFFQRLAREERIMEWFKSHLHRLAHRLTLDYQHTVDIAALVRSDVKRDLTEVQLDELEVQMLN